MTQIKIKVGDDKIDASQFAATEGSPGHGAHILFFGVVRRENLGRQVVAVAYDAFAPLAESVLSEICNEAAKKFGGGLIFDLAHRTGKLVVGEISLAISVSSKHRDESYQASRYVVEELKVRAPIWKKEFYEDGETEWLKGHALCGHAATEAHASGADHSKIPPLSSTTSP